MRIGLVGFWVLVLCGFLNGMAPVAEPPAGPQRWEEDIQKFELQDRQQPPPEGAVLFVGSSSIRGWNTQQSFPQIRTLNRGFGGSQISDVLHYFDRVVVPYQPRAIVLYSGDNDVAAGKSAAQVARDFQELLDRVTAQLPRTDFFFLAIKPSEARWDKWDTMRAANQRIRKLIQQSPRAHYVDTAAALLNEQGRPDAQYFVDDKLHLNEAGYARWTSLVRKSLDQHAHDRDALDQPERNAADPAEHTQLVANRAARPPRWVYLQMNLQVPDNLQQTLAILRRAAAAGYNGIVLADYKLNILDRVPEFYFDHVRQLRAAAEQLNLEIIPCVAPFGYSDGLLAHNPNLAEGLPARDVAMHARQGLVELPRPSSPLLPGGDFEQHQGHRALGWDLQDAPGSASFIDTEVYHKGRSSLRWTDPGRNAQESAGNARVARLIDVAPFRQYHASVWIKTESFSSAGSVRLFAMSPSGYVLSHSNLGVRSTQGWTEHHIVFNSLENQQVRLYCGTWGGTQGTLWMDDLRLEETAFVNLLRRTGCPLKVVGADGTEFVEGRDYAELRDPQLGQVPWAGSYDVWHPPPTLRLLGGSRIQEGQPLRASFWHTVTIYDNQVTCCLDHPEVFEVFQQQLARVNELLEPTTWFLSHDEIRVANWCEACHRKDRSAGQLLADNVRRCVQQVRKLDPDARLCIWSDMFDPQHNARAEFYLVNGDLTGSWEGLPADVIVVNWNHQHAAQSLPFFDNRGHAQILAGYYDHAPQQIATWLKTGASTQQPLGVMYTTWRGDFSQLEAFAEAAW